MAIGAVSVMFTVFCIYLAVMMFLHYPWVLLSIVFLVAAYRIGIEVIEHTYNDEEVWGAIVEDFGRVKSWVLKQMKDRLRW